MAQKEEVRFIRKGGRVIPIRAKKGKKGEKKRERGPKIPTKGEIVRAHAIVGASSGFLIADTKYVIDKSVPYVKKAIGIASEVKKQKEIYQTAEAGEAAVRAGSNPLVGQFREYASQRLNNMPKRKSLPLQWEETVLDNKTIEMVRGPMETRGGGMRMSDKRSFLRPWVAADPAMGKALSGVNPLRIEKIERSFRSRLDAEIALDRAVKKAKPRLDKVALANLSGQKTRAVLRVHQLAAEARALDAEYIKTMQFKPRFKASGKGLLIGIGAGAGIGLLRAEGIQEKMRELRRKNAKSKRR